MTSAHHVIFLPGLGDPRAQERIALQKIWRRFGVTVHYHPLYWRRDDPYATKEAGVLKLVDSLKKQGHTVSLASASAGASIALNVYAKRKSDIAGVVFISGKIQNIQAVAETYYKKNPAFRESLAKLPASLRALTTKDRARILCLHPLFDEVVPIADTTIEGAETKIIFSVGHVVSIAIAIILYARTITNFLKRQAT